MASKEQALIAEAIGQRIREQRAALGWSQEGLARSCDPPLSRETVRRAEKGAGKATIELVTVDQLLRGEIPDLSEAATGVLIPDLPLPKAREPDARPTVEELVESDASTPSKNL